MGRCDYLGLRDDPVTVLDFASEGNVCHHADPAAPPDFIHQEAYCLTDEHIYCPIFLRAERKPLPKDITFQDYRKYSALKKAYRWVWLIILLVLLAISVGVAMSFNRMPSSPVQMPAATIKATAVQTPRAIENEAPAPITSPASPTKSPLPVDLSTAPESTAPGCTPPAGWILYTALPSDSIEQLSLTVGISETLLRSMNCMGNDITLQSGDQIFIPSLPANTPVLATETPAPTDAPVSAPGSSPNPTQTATSRPVKTVSSPVSPTETIPTARPPVPSPTKQPTNTAVVLPPSPTSAPPPATPTSPPPPTP